MSFDLLLLRFEAGNVVRFEEPALCAALERHGQPTAAGASYATTRDGVDFELIRTAAADHDELMLSMRGISSGMFELVYDLAQAAKLTLVVPDEDTAVLVAQESLIADLPDAYAAKAVSCGSAAELASQLLPIYERWRGWAL